MAMAMLITTTACRTGLMLARQASRSRCMASLHDCIPSLDIYYVEVLHVFFPESIQIICNFFRLAGDARSSESLKDGPPELARQSTSQLPQQAEPLVEQEALKAKDGALEAEQAPAPAPAMEPTPAAAPESTPQPPAATKWFPCCSCCPFCC